MKTYTHGQDLEGNFLNPHQGTCLLILEREEGRERERERNIAWLPLIYAPTGDQTLNHSVYRTMLQPTELHWPGGKGFFYTGLHTFLKILYLHLEGGRKRGKEILIGCLSHALSWGPCPQCRYVP